MVPEKSAGDNQEMTVPSVRNWSQTVRMLSIQLSQ